MLTFGFKFESWISLLIETFSYKQLKKIITQNAETVWVKRPSSLDDFIGFSEKREEGKNNDELLLHDPFITTAEAQ